uniref:Exodeoxyribonuclease 7 large subunit n=1 Tax=Thermosporothrix sp. COM3 TaxID=2490863 RepID=A0A455SN67_9CHLR|nr:exodeoxyribonuclease VII large subunit [Thermosporothrix sp. COM3]
MSAMHPGYLPGFADEWSVSALSRYLKELLETDDVVRYVRVHGEVSNCKTYPSGHCYFTLKDQDAQLNCVFFKQARLRSEAPTLRNGMALSAEGRISFYDRDGKLQLYVENVTPHEGPGVLFERFQRLKELLEAEGLFAPERKRPLPAQPEVIGIVTSLQAAALRDMLYMLRTRYPLARVILAPALVQGEDAPASIAAALDLLNEHDEAEVIIVGRGGGSIEELWAFNEEVVARAIARSRIPVISAVGHETDFTIADLVADYRAPTPTAAATVAVPDIADWQAQLTVLQRQLMDAMLERLKELTDEVESVQRELERVSPLNMIDAYQQRIDSLTASLQISMRHHISLYQERLHGLALQLHSLSPLLTIARGYAVVRRARDQQPVTSTQQVQAGENLTIQVQDGTIPVQVLAEHIQSTG